MCSNYIDIYGVQKFMAVLYLANNAIVQFDKKYFPKVEYGVGNIFFLHPGANFTSPNPVA